MKRICSIPVIVIVMVVMSCSSDVKTDASADTSLPKTATQKKYDLQLEPRGVQWDDAKKLIAQSDCAACHEPFRRTVAPTYFMIAKRYNPTNTNISKLANRIIKGSYDVWPGYTTMNEHPNLSRKDARIIVEYILAFNQTR